MTFKVKKESNKRVVTCLICVVFVWFDAYNRLEIDP